MLLFAYERSSARILAVVDEYVGQRQPSRPIPAAATRVHGMSEEHVRGQTLDHQRVRALLQRAEFLVSHHAAFDRRFVLQLYPDLASRRWLCSLEGIDWRGHGFKSRSLQALLEAHAIRSDVRHRAQADCRALLALLERPSANGNTYLYELLNHYDMLGASHPHVDQPLLRVGPEASDWAIS
ncbi:exonuclease domain-containing protein [Geochorda subterranea]|uniref:exonuclease domain-containing protein n=1 Tax=Geochorda subterranea TaxID=3109564 RepID=UPI00386010E5